MDALSRRQVVDKLIVAYVDWRNACARVNESYRSCASETGPGSKVAFGAYMAALDAEEHAAEVYATLVKRAGELPWSDAAPAQAQATGHANAGS